MITSTISQNQSVNYDPFTGPIIEKIILTTQAQAEIWIDCKLGGEDANKGYNESISLVLEGELEKESLNKAIQKLVERHEALRGVFSPDGRYMSILQYTPFKVTYHDFSQLTSDKTESALADYLNNDANHNFDLIRGPLIKFGLIKICDKISHLIITAHHIICDGWSFGIILEDLGKLYSAYKTNQIPNLPKVESFSSYADDEQEFIISEEQIKTEKFWIDLFKDSIPELTLPTDFPRPKLRTYKSERLDFSFNLQLLDQLKKVGLKSGCSLVTTLMSAFEVFLYKLTGQDDIVVGLPSAGQTVNGRIQLVGHCVNLLPLRSKLDSRKSFRAYLKERKTSLLDAYDHKQLSFGELLQKLPLQRDPSKVPLVPVVFNIDVGMTNLVSFYDLEFKVISNPRVSDAFEIFLNASDTKDDFILQWSYNSSLFKSATIKKMMIDFEAIVERIVENPDITLREIIKTDESIYKNLNNTAAHYPNLALHHLLEKQTKLSFKKTAIKFDGSEISYGMLEQQVNLLAHSLLEKGVGYGDFVGVCLPRSKKLVITLLAIMKCGAAYLPLDPNYPNERLDFMINDSEAKFLITTDEFSSKLNTKASKFLLEDLFTNLSKYPLEPLKIEVSPNDLAYLLYTSGSTGKPKGVQVTHRNLVNFLTSMAKEPGIDETDSLLSITTISFDIAGLELFLPLLKGAELIVANEETAKDGRLMLDLIKKEKITMLQATPTSWQMLLDSGWDNPYPIKALCGGEALPLALAKKLLAKVDELWNVYGPTETTIWSAVKQITMEDELITIGHPIANTQLYLLNDQDMLVKNGAIGELCIAGDGVSKGYWKRPELTAEKFVTNPFGLAENKILYRTGDLGKLLDNGEVQCLGRIDHQVKIRGHRIELGEIEQALDQLAAVQSSVVMVNNDRLVSYLILNQENYDTANLINQWKQSLIHQLPAHMVPNEFNVIDEFPKTLNGKIDRKSLLTLSSKKVERISYTSPRSKTEHLVSKIWCDVLEREKINIQSDFFELGGHSILAIKVVVRLEKEIGKKLPLSVIMVYPTIEKLANFLDKDDKKKSWNSLVALRKDGNKTPLYIVHGAHFGIYIFNDLAKLLDDDQPVYALQPKGLDGEEEPHDSIVDMAAHYISEMEASNPDGPYALAGFSMGGIIAFEMAKQLRAKGKKVTMLASFDSYIYPSYFYSNALKKSIVSFLYKGGQMIYVTLNMFSSKKNFIRRIELLKLRFQGIYMRLKLGREKQFQLQHNRPLKMDRMHILACKKYIMTPQDIVIDLFKAKDNVFFAHDFKFLGWKKFAKKGVNRYMIPGNHVDMFAPPNVEVYANSLQRVMDNYNADNCE
ncbi:amino acid adenylation domain-containing protein [Winogradskyella echinorum]|uniref:Amino acid adenylation domain-containing protein n=1 Tax=Winogradskyella echinorum TaxID=538189 RepID=A0ABR6Y4V4_9FLAO|nr:non-ribosomal peptide synthetase [Winogradskyella echinorum]MBC3847753.1 amino acid adenylation domain-containing protein [Winogradskyella echinorum]MBC5752101.1 amino acid adenylation domain-containing protein [Winogradskyella echinorum]